MTGVHVIADLVFPESLRQIWPNSDRSLLQRVVTAYVSESGQLDAIELVKSEDNNGLCHENTHELLEFK